MCVYKYNFMEIAHCVCDLWRFLFLFVETDQSCELWKPSLAHQDGIWEMVRVDHMTMEIVYTELRDVWMKCVGLRVINRNVFCPNRPHGGAITGRCGIFRAEVRRWHPGSVCAVWHGWVQWCLLTGRLTGNGRTVTQCKTYSLPKPSTWW